MKRKEGRRLKVWVLIEEKQGSCAVRRRVEETDGKRRIREERKIRKRKMG